MNVMRAIRMLKCNSNWCLLGEIMVFTQSGHTAVKFLTLKVCGERVAGVAGFLEAALLMSNWHIIF